MWFAATKLIPFALTLHLFLPVPPGCQCTPLHSDAASLCYSFSVNKTGSGPWWRKVQGQLNEEPFISCDSNNNCHAVGLLGNRLDATKPWEAQVGTLKDVADLFKDQSIQMNLENNAMRDQPTLQATMLSQYEQGQNVGASWRFNISGKYSFILDTMNMSFKQISLEARSIMNDEQLMKDLKIISTADCSYWLKELLKHQKKNQRSTSRATGITLLTSASATQPQLTTKLQYEKVFVPIAAVIAIILPLIVGIVVKPHPQGGTTQVRRQLEISLTAEKDFNSVAEPTLGLFGLLLL
ncbi:UL16-binding protein 6-like [Microtus ochrogaster]|uniref:UL16-binding protein 6-like n=1 Tax=Microtus ochrogaster TaxID=79684 RepID=A0ABM1AYZ9_MICOH|nr:UL16-binding protein 6-like [Microtus ochrogaster]